MCELLGGRLKRIVIRLDSETILDQFRKIPAQLIVVHLHPMSLNLIDLQKPTQLPYYFEKGRSEEEAEECRGSRYMHHSDEEKRLKSPSTLRNQGIIERC